MGFCFGVDSDIDLAMVIEIFFVSDLFEMWEKVCFMDVKFWEANSKARSLTGIILRDRVTRRGRPRVLIVNVKEVNMVG